MRSIVECLQGCAHPVPSSWLGGVIEGGQEIVVAGERGDRCVFNEVVKLPGHIRLHRCVVAIPCAPGVAFCLTLDPGDYVRGEPPMDISEVEPSRQEYVRVGFEPRHNLLLRPGVEEPVHHVLPWQFLTGKERRVRQRALANRVLRKPEELCSQRKRYGPAVAKEADERLS